MEIGDDATVGWADSNCEPRQTRLSGAVARYFNYEVEGRTRSCSGRGRYDGIGYVVSHHSRGAMLESGDAAATRWILRGPHHAIYEARWAATAPGSDRPITFTVQWFFASGRSHPVYAITYDTSALAPGEYRGDSRSPYGSIGFDGDVYGTISGVGWGDAFQFHTSGARYDKNNAWDYTVPNEVPYAMEWIDSADAEMGLVQTQSQTQHTAGGYWFYSAWGTRSDGPMPENWNWPFQLNQYSFSPGGSTNSTRLAWGTNFGAVGAPRYAAYGEDPDTPGADSPSGYPYQSYSVYVALGDHAAGTISNLAQDVSTALHARFEMADGEIVRMVPGGVGRTDLVQTDPPGYDARYGVFRFRASDEGVALRLSSPARPLTSAVFVVVGLMAVRSVRLDGRDLVIGAGALVSSDAAGSWITIRERMTDGAHLEIR